MCVRVCACVCVCVRVCACVCVCVSECGVSKRESVHVVEPSNTHFHRQTTLMEETQRKPSNVVSSKGNLFEKYLIWTNFDSKRFFQIKTRIESSQCENKL